MPFVEVAFAFCSLLIVPFLGFVSTMDERVFRAMLWFWGLWFLVCLVLLFAAGAGVTPIGPGDIVTPEQRTAWLNTPFVRMASGAAVVGIVVGAPFVAITWAMRQPAIARPVRFVLKLVQVVGFAIAGWQFATRYLLPYLAGVRA